MKDPLEPTGPILQSPPRAETLRFTYGSGDRPLAGYTIKRGIGRGGFGEVYYGTSDGGKEVALKLVQRNLEVELRGVTQCLNLKHANLVGLYDVKQADNGDYWVVMEYVAGECLVDAIDRHPQGMPPADALQWLQGICAAVAYLHDRGIVHRDLKPANIFMEDAVVKVGDYGLSKFITHSRRSGQTESVGTVHYMAPEIANGRYGKEIDIYAAGVILYEMLTGQVPFEGESVGEVLMKHLTAEPDLAAVPESFRAVVGRSLAKDPSRRYSSIGALSDDLKIVAGDAWSAAGMAPVRAAPAAPPEPLDLGESDFVAATPAPPRAPSPPPSPPPTGLWASFLREDPVMRWLRRKWQGLSPNNPWHVIGFTGLVLLLVFTAGFWGVLPIAALSYVAAALMVRWLKGPIVQTAAPADRQRGAVVRPLAPVVPPPSRDGKAVAARANELRSATEPNRRAGRKVPSGLFVLMVLLLGAGLGLLTGGVVQAIGHDEDAAALLGISCGLFVAGTALFRGFPHSRWWRTVVALFLGTCVGMAVGALGMTTWRDDEAALIGTGAGFLTGGLLLARALRGLGWWRAIAAPLIALGVGLVVFGLADAWRFRDEVAGMLGTGCGLLVCGMAAYRLGLDRPARAAYAPRPRSRGHRTRWTAAFAVIVLFVIAMMVMSTLSGRYAGPAASLPLKTWSGITRSHPGPHGPACADIEMIIRTYPFSNDRTRELKKIAGRPGLSADEQIHLIDAVLDEIQFANDQTEVLLPLASSPELTAMARYHLSTNIDRIAYQSDRERITQALLQNPQKDFDERQSPQSAIEQGATEQASTTITVEAAQGGSGATASEAPPENNE